MIHAITDVEQENPKAYCDRKYWDQNTTWTTNRAYYRQQKKCSKRWKNAQLPWTNLFLKTNFNVKNLGVTLKQYLTFLKYNVNPVLISRDWKLMSRFCRIKQPTEKSLSEQSHELFILTKHLNAIFLKTLSITFFKKINSNNLDQVTYLQNQFQENHQRQKAKTALNCS